MPFISGVLLEEAQRKMKGEVQLKLILLYISSRARWMAPEIPAPPTSLNQCYDGEEVELGTYAKNFDYTIVTRNAIGKFYGKRCRVNLI